MFQTPSKRGGDQLRVASRPEPLWPVAAPDSDGNQRHLFLHPIC